MPNFLTPSFLLFYFCPPIHSPLPLDDFEALSRLSTKLEKLEKKAATRGGAGLPRVDSEAPSAAAGAAGGAPGDGSDAGDAAAAAAAAAGGAGGAMADMEGGAQGEEEEGEEAQEEAATAALEVGGGEGVLLSLESLVLVSVLREGVMGRFLSVRLLLQMLSDFESGRKWTEGRYSQLSITLTSFLIPAYDPSSNSIQNPLLNSPHTK